jgi:predicted NBD/HSP70 family sugar kinase
MAHQQMHEQWTDLLDELKRLSGELKGQSGVSHELLGGVLSRVMRGGRGIGRGVPRIEITKGSMLVRPRPLSPGTVGKATDALRDIGLLTQLPAQPGKRGGAVAPLTLGSDTWAVVGIHVQYHGLQLQGLTGVLARLDGEEILSRTQELDSSGPRDDEAVLVEGADTLVRKLLKEADSEKGIRLTERNLLGVGLEVGGHVHNGEVIYATLAKHPDRQKIGPGLAERLKLPVVVENDVTTLAIQAFYQGRFKYLDAAMVEVFDEGVGGALIIDGRIYRGGSGMAMEPGHLTVEYGTNLAPTQLPIPPRSATADSDQPRGFADPCSCHPYKYGHVDTLATPARIRGELQVDDIEAAAETPALVPDAEHPDSYRLSREGAAFRRAGTALGRGLAQVINIINPSQLLLRLPTALAAATPQTSGAQYLAAVESAVNQAFSTGPRDARAGAQR